MDVKDLLNSSNLTFDNIFSNVFNYFTVSYKRFIKFAKPKFVLSDLESLLNNVVNISALNTQSRSALLSNITYFSLKNGAPFS